jgi:beta-glucoside operon transcriptional antiterminator
MKIAKILNNNVVVTLDSRESEIVVMGRGIAFKHKVGDEIDPSQIDKVFTLSNREITDKFQQLLTIIPMEHMLIAEKTIDYAKTQYDRKLNESIYITLPDHISMAIKRYKNGLVLKNPLLEDIKRFYRDEFEIGEKAIQIVKEQTGIEFLKDEAAFIAIHFVNAELNEGNQEISRVYEIARIIQEILNIVKTYFNIEYDENSLNYYRFVTHLRFFAQRLLTKTDYANDDPELFEMVKSRYKKAFQCTEKITRFIQYKYHYNLGSEEMLYLTVHIERISRTTIT